MADLYKVVYPVNGGTQKTAMVSATSIANAISAVKTNDTNHAINMQHITCVVWVPNIITGS